MACLDFVQTPLQESCNNTLQAITAAPNTFMDAHTDNPEPTVSAVMPVFNAQHTLANAIESLLHQTEPSLEIVIVDDGSTDQTPRILDQFRRRDERVRVLTRRHAGITAALNTGINAAHGTFIARMDADDESFPERLQLQRRFLEMHPECGLVACQVSYGGNRAVQRGYALYVDWTNSLLKYEDIALNRFVESPFAHPSVMFRKTLIDQFGSYRDGPFPEDYELWLRWLEADVKMWKLPMKLLLWNDPPQRLSRTDPRYHVRAFHQCKAGYLARWLQRNNPHHPFVIVWGAGRESRKRAEYLTGFGVEIAAYIDIDPRKIGKSIHGRRVLSAAQVPPPGTAFIVSFVSSRGARNDIRQQLAAGGWIEGRDFVMAG